MKDKDWGSGPAFPSSYVAELGLSIRAWFAGQALSGLMNPAGGARDLTGDDAVESLAKIAYRIADAMIAAGEIPPANLFVAEGELFADVSKVAPIPGE